MDYMRAMEDTVRLMEVRVSEGSRHHTMSATGETGTLHILSMRERMRDDFGMSHGKANRWLGYIQGAMVAHGLATLAEMKDINRKYAG